MPAKVLVEAYDRRAWEWKYNVLVEAENPEQALQAAVDYCEYNSEDEVEWVDLVGYINHQQFWKIKEQ